MVVNRTSTGNLQIFSWPFSSRVTRQRQQPLIHSILMFNYLEQNVYAHYWGNTFCFPLVHKARLSQKCTFATLSVHFAYTSAYKVFLTEAWCT